MDLQHDEEPEQEVPGDSGEIDAYTGMPLPELELFIATMKSLNIKTYDDVLLYSQVPRVFEDLGNPEKSNLPIVN